MRKKSELEDFSLISQCSEPSPSEKRGLSTCGEEDDRLLRVDEAARLLGLSTGGLYHLVSQSRVPVVKISSRCIRFSRRALAEWIESVSQPAKNDSR
jgi:excisionase family DNA binding protein